MIRILPRLSLLLLAACAAATADTEAELERIAQVIDGFHDAAARGDQHRYLGYLADNAVFLGTDEWERWPKQPEFSDYVGQRFRDGSGWAYRSVERHIELADGQDVAWFDEVVESASNGRFRGTGVVTRVDGEWKIAHYAMSFLVFNEDWQTVIELTRKTREAKAQDPE